MAVAYRLSWASNKHNTAVVNMEYSCVTCDRYFGSKEALEGHEQASPVHMKKFYCKTCGCFLGSNKALKRHKWSFQVYQTCSEYSPDASSISRCDEAASSKTWTSDPTLDMTSLIQHFSRVLVSANPATNVSSTARAKVHKPIRETREFFMFPELHPNVADAISIDISSTWFNEDDKDENFD